jgi:preprotein translocase subunit YajC
LIKLKVQWILAFIILKRRLNIMKKLLSFLSVLLVSTATIAQEAAAPAGEAAQQPGLTSLVFQLGIIFAIFYFLLIRPQNKKYRNHAQMVAGLQKGDKVVTGGGIVGVITSADDKSRFVEVEIASGTKVEVLRSTVSELVEAKNKPAQKEQTNKK